MQHDVALSKSLYVLGGHVVQLPPALPKLPAPQGDGAGTTKLALLVNLIDDAFDTTVVLARTVQPRATEAVPESPLDANAVILCGPGNKQTVRVPCIQFA